MCFIAKIRRQKIFSQTKESAEKEEEEEEKTNNKPTGNESRKQQTHMVIITEIGAICNQVVVNINFDKVYLLFKKNFLLLLLFCCTCAI